MQRQGKRFFSEKKNQETFVSLGCAPLKRAVSALRDCVSESVSLVFLKIDAAHHQFEFCRQTNRVFYAEPRSLVASDLPR